MEGRGEVKEVNLRGGNLSYVVCILPCPDL